MIVAAFLPMLIVGTVINFQYWRRSFAAKVPDVEQAN
jgi:hypothetical protein